MKKINFLYDFMTPTGFLPFGYQLTDLPIIFNEINDTLLGFTNNVIRTVQDPTFAVSSKTQDPFESLSDYFRRDFNFKRVLTNNLTNKQIKEDINLFVITSTHDESIVKYITNLNFNDIFSKKSFSLFKSNKNFKLVIIDEKEGGFSYTDEFFNNICRFATEHKLADNKIIFITNTSDIRKVYQKYLEKYNVPSFMTCDSINFYIVGDPGKNILNYENKTNNYELDTLLDNGVEYSLDQSPPLHFRDKYFLCLNRNSSRFHRPTMVLKLIKNNLFDKGLVSLFRSWEFDEFCEKPESNHFKINIKDKYPFTIDYDDADEVAEMHNYFTKKDMWNDTYFSIVNETSVIEDSVFITEKVIRPMIYFHPFVVYGNPGTLRELKKLGFETFPEFFDENYDNIMNKTQRLGVIIRSVNGLCSLPLKEIHKLYESVYPKLVHNRNLLVKMSIDNYVGNKFLQIVDT